MTNRRLFLVLVLVLMTPLAAHAAAIEVNSLELNGFFTFQHTSATEDIFGLGEIDLSTTVFDLEPGVGYFLTSNWEILGNLIIQHQSIADFSSDSFGIKASGYYHFNTTGTIIPFAGAGIGVLTNGGDSDADESSVIVPEIVVGIRWPFKDIISFNFMGGYRHVTNYLGTDADGDTFFLAAGFSIFLQGGATQ